MKTKGRLAFSMYPAGKFVDNPGGTMYLAGYRAGPLFVSDPDECGAVWWRTPLLEQYRLRCRQM